MARGGRYAERPRARLLRDRRRARMGDRREGPSEAQGADPLDRRRETRGGRRERSRQRTVLAVARRGFEPDSSLKEVRSRPKAAADPLVPIEAPKLLP